MIQVEAIFHNGVFEPLGPVDLKENERVVLAFAPMEKDALTKWAEEARELRAAMFRRHGFLPDSALEIAEDRLR